jgi:Tol biopolymer transport system component
VLALNCSADDETVSAPAFKGGLLRVITTTTGADLDPNGYVVVLNNGRSRLPVSVNGTLSIIGGVGGYAIELTDVAPNCKIDDTSGGGTRRIVYVTAAGDTVDVTFTVTCVALASLQVTVTTDGTDLDPDGYRVEAYGRSSNQYSWTTIGTNGSVALGRFAPGDHVVQLLGVAANCEAPSSPRRINLTSGIVDSISFAVSCGPVTRLAFVSGAEGTNRDIYLVNSNGTGLIRLTDDPAVDEDPAWSPDGTRIAFTSSRNGGREIYVMGADGSNPIRLNAAGYRPSWSPDARRIVFVSDRDGNAELYVMNADGTQQTRLTNNRTRDTDPAWSPDGRRIAFSNNADPNLQPGASAIFVMNVDGSGLARVTMFEGAVGQPAWSPDGTRLAYSQTQCAGYYSCYPAVFVTDTNGFQPFEIGIGQDPAWSPDGKKIAATGFECDYYGYEPCAISGIMILSAAGFSATEVRNIQWNGMLTKAVNTNPSWRW